MAEAMGIPVPWVLTGVFAIGAGMAAASGVLFAPLVGVNRAMGSTGSCGPSSSSWSAAWAVSPARSWRRSSISLLEAYASLWVSPAQAVIVSFVVLILTLLFRPTGLFVATPK